MLTQFTLNEFYNEYKLAHNEKWFMKVTEISTTMKNVDRLTQMCCLHEAVGKDTSMIFI